jgi:hypothetical protein
VVAVASPGARAAALVKLVLGRNLIPNLSVGMQTSAGVLVLCLRWDNMRSAHPGPDGPKWHNASRLETRLALGTGCRATLYRAHTAQGAAVLVGAGLEEALRTDER